MSPGPAPRTRTWRVISIAAGLLLSTLFFGLLVMLLGARADGPLLARLAIYGFAIAMFGSIGLLGLIPLRIEWRIRRALRRFGPCCPSCGQIDEQRPAHCLACEYPLTTTASHWNLSSNDRLFGVAMYGIFAAIACLGVFLFVGDGHDHPSLGAATAGYLLGALMLLVGVGGMVGGWIVSRQQRDGLVRLAYVHRESLRSTYAQIEMRGDALRAHGSSRTIIVPRVVADLHHEPTSFERGFACLLTDWIAEASISLERVRTRNWSRDDFAYEQDMSLHLPFRAPIEPAAIERSQHDQWEVRFVVDAEQVLGTLVLDGDALEPFDGDQTTVAQLAAVIRESTEAVKRVEALAGDPRAQDVDAWALAAAMDG